MVNNNHIFSPFSCAPLYVVMDVLVYVRHISYLARWYAKRFLHPDIVAPYDYIFIWDEDLGVENFDPEEWDKKSDILLLIYRLLIKLFFKPKCQCNCRYIKLVRKHGLDISQPGLSPDSGMTWQMTRMRNDTEVHK